VMPWKDVALFHYPHVLTRYGESVDGISRLLYGRWWQPVRRRLAGRFGLRAIGSPLYRLVDPLAVRTYGGFFEEIHRIIQAHVT